MARAGASISQPGIKARRTIFGVKAEIGGTVAKARINQSVSLRAEFGVGFTSETWIWMAGTWNDNYNWNDTKNWKDS